MGPVQKTMLPASILEGPVQQTSKGPVKGCYIRLLQQSFNRVSKVACHQGYINTKDQGSCTNIVLQISKKLHKHSSSDFRGTCYIQFHLKRDLLWTVKINHIWTMKISPTCACQLNFWSTNKCNVLL